MDNIFNDYLHRVYLVVDVSITFRKQNLKSDLYISILLSFSNLIKI